MVFAPVDISNIACCSGSYYINRFLPADHIHSTFPFANATAIRIVAQSDLSFIYRRLSFRADRFELKSRRSPGSCVINVYEREKEKEKLYKKYYDRCTLLFVKYIL